MDEPDFPRKYAVSPYILSARRARGSGRRSPTRLADETCLLFTPEGQRGEFACREAVLALDLPDSTPGPHVAVVRSDRPEAAFERLEMIAGLGYEYGYDPEYISEADVRRLAE